MAKLIITLLALFVAGCSGNPTTPTPAPPAIPQLAGNWSGFASETASPVVGCTVGTARVTFSQTGTTLTGTWTITYANVACNGGGTVTGAITDPTVSLTLTPSDVTRCPYRVTGAMTSSSINGTYAAFNCTGSSSGSFVIQKQ